MNYSELRQCLLWPFQAKIQFESNSQLTLSPAANSLRCGLSRRRYNLKATHNRFCLTVFHIIVVAFPGEDTI